MSEGHGAETLHGLGRHSFFDDERSVGGILLRPARASDFEALDADLPYRVKALTAEIDGRVIGTGGLAFINGTVAAFVIATDEMRRHPRALHAAGLAVMAEAERLGIRRVVALAEPGIEPAGRWMSRLGFVVNDEEVWTWLHSH